MRRRLIHCPDCAYRGEPTGRPWSDVFLGVASLLLGGGSGIVEHWRDIFAAKTCPQCGNPRTVSISDSDEATG